MMKTKRSDIDTEKLAGPSIAGEYLTPIELARELKISLRSVARLHSQRTGPPRVKVGALIRFRRTAVNEWLLAKEQAEPRARRLRSE